MDALATAAVGNMLLLSQQQVFHDAVRALHG
jgi:hypothetical protein